MTTRRLDAQCPAMLVVEPKPNARSRSPVRESFDAIGIESEPRTRGFERKPIDDLAASCTSGQESKQRDEGQGDGRAMECASVGDPIRNRVVPLANDSTAPTASSFNAADTAPAKDRIDRGHQGIDVRQHHDDIFGCQCGIAIKGVAKRGFDHFQLSFGAVAEMNLKGSISGRNGARNFCDVAFV